MPYIGNIVQDFSVSTAMLNTDSVTSIKIDDGTIVNADINDSAAIAMSKLALSITNSEVNASAAIAGTKISPDFGSQNIATTGTLACGDITSSDGNGNLTLKDNNHTGSNCEHLINFTASDDTSLMNIGTPFGSNNLFFKYGSTELVSIGTSGQVDFAGNVDCNAGIDVTGNITGTADMTIDTNTLHVDSSNNRVGIGVTNPASKLSVVDDSGIAIEATTNGANGKLTIIGKNTSGQVSAISRIESKPENSGNAATSTLFLNRDSANAVNTHMTITSAGRVGIGTTGPGHLLHVQNDSVTTTKITVESTGTDSYPAFRVKNDARSYDLGINGATDSFRIFDVTGNTQRITLDTTGRLAINGAGTKGMLEVRASGGAADQLTAVFGANEGTTAGTLSNNADKACRIGIQHYQTAEEPFAMIVGASGSSENSLTFGGSTSLMNAANLIRFYTTTTNTTVTGIERMRIDSSGRSLFSGTLGYANIPLSGNPANAAIQIRCTSKYNGIAFGEGAVNGAIGLGGDDTTTAMVFVANANPANLGGGTKDIFEWHAGNSGGGGPGKYMTLDTSGHLALSQGNLEFASGSGIDFSAVSDGSRTVTTDGNKFDDYEEGSWAPALSFSGTNNAASFDIQQGVYRKIGSLVFVAYALRSTNFNGSSGAVRISGLPFSSTNTPVSNISTNGVFPIQGVSFSGEFISQQLSGTLIELYGVSKTTSGNNYNSIGVSEMNATGSMFIKGQICYNAA